PRSPAAVADLQAAAAGTQPTAGPGLLGPTLGPEGLADIRTRLASLGVELAEAERDGNALEVQELQQERGRILDRRRAPEAARGGPGGGRDHSEAREQARKAVRIAIRRALERIGGHDRALAAHLRGSIQTGDHVVYAPPAPVEWEC